jgi:hypothetical protein
MGLWWDILVGLSGILTGDMAKQDNCGCFGARLHIIGIGVP